MRRFRHAILAACLPFALIPHTIEAKGGHGLDEGTQCPFESERHFHQEMERHRRHHEFEREWHRQHLERERERERQLEQFLEERRIESERKRVREVAPIPHVLKIAQLPSNEKLCAVDLNEIKKILDELWQRIRKTRNPIKTAIGYIALPIVIVIELIRALIRFLRFSKYFTWFVKRNAAFRRACDNGSVVRPFRDGVCRFCGRKATEVWKDPVAKAELGVCEDCFEIERGFLAATRGIAFLCGVAVFFFATGYIYFYNWPIDWCKDSVLFACALGGILGVIAFLALRSGLARLVAYVFHLLIVRHEDKTIH